MKPRYRHCFYALLRGSILLPLLLGVGFLTRSIAPAVAQEPAKEKQEKPVLAASEEYILGIDDVISLSAPGHEDIKQDCVVLRDGKVYVNGLKDPVVAAGKTLSQVREEIFKGLDRLYNNVELSVALKESHSRMVTVIGARSSGLFQLRKDMRVSSLMAIAGGSPGKTKVVVGTLIRGFKKIKLDMAKIIGTNPDPAADLLLEVNDTLVLDLNEEAPPPTFSVLGAVIKGGSFPMPLDGSPITIARAIAEAGGKNEKASLSNVVLQRKGEKIKLNLYSLLVEGKADAPEGKFDMQDGDILLIPELEAKYQVLGGVNKPGAYPLPDGKTIDIIQALAEAGGANQSGELRRVALRRMVNGKPTLLQINMLNLVSKADAKQNTVMQDGDVLFIPIRSQNGGILEFLNPLFTFTNLFTLFRR